MRFFAAALCAAFCLCQSAQAAPSHALTLFGKPKYGADFEHFEYANPDAPKGGTFRLSDTVVYDSLNPFILKGIAPPAMGMIYESLMVGSLDEPQSFYGLIAESIDISPDKKTIDFTLRKDARWHDGKAITAEDVVFTLDTLKTKGHPTYRIILKPVEKAEALTPHKVRFHNSEPENREIPIILAGLSILPKHYYENREFEKTTLEPPLGSGPYRISKVDQGRSITFERVKDHWSENLPVNKGQYNFDTIHVDIFRDETVDLEALKAGRYDFREEFIARNWATAFDIPAVKEGRLIKTKVPHKIPRGMQGFIFNMRKTKYQDVRVREAIDLAMDFEWMNKTLFYDAYERTQSYFQNTDFMATGTPEGAELKLLEPFRKDLPAALFTTPYHTPKTDGSGTSRENLLRAQKLLNEAGWVMKDGARVHKDTGEKLSIEFMMRQKTFERVIGSMIRNLRRLGIDATFRYVDDSQYQKRLDSFDFDVISIWWNKDMFFPGSEQMAQWHSSQADVAGTRNLGGVKNPVVDALVKQVVNANSIETLKPAVQALDRVLQWEHYVIPHWHIAAWRILYWDKFERPKITPSYGVGLDTWWMKSGTSCQNSEFSKSTGNCTLDSGASGAKP